MPRPKRDDKIYVNNADDTESSYRIIGVMSHPSYEIYYLEPLDGGKLATITFSDFRELENAKKARMERGETRKGD